MICKEKTLNPDYLEKKLKKKIMTIGFFCAEVLYRLKENDDLNCPCGSCFSENIHLKHLIKQMENEGHIKQRPLLNFTGKGDCGRRLGERA